MSEPVWSDTMRKSDLFGRRLLRLPAVLQFSGYGRTQLFHWIRRGKFPQPVKLNDGGRAIAWDESELLAWREARKAARDQAA
jgi:prophage regulatory protein